MIHRMFGNDGVGPGGGSGSRKLLYPVSWASGCCERSWINWLPLHLAEGIDRSSTGCSVINRETDLYCGTDGEKNDYFHYTLLNQLFLRICTTLAEWPHQDNTLIPPTNPLQKGAKYISKVLRPLWNFLFSSSWAYFFGLWKLLVSSFEVLVKF